MKVAIFGNAFSKENEKYFDLLINILKDANAQIMLEKEYYQKIIDLKNHFDKYPLFDQKRGLDKSVDFIFTLGGDGTILRVVSYVKDLEIPVVGINTGRLGFMATLAKNDIQSKMKDVFSGNYDIVERSLLELTTSHKVNSLPFNYALNEISVNRKDATSMVTVDAYLDGEFLNSYWGDGLLVATPTGSTGYSLSCGGPIIMPGSNNVVLTPIAPHNLFARPFVLPDSTEIDLVIKGRADSYMLSLDSNLVSVPEGIKLKIKKADANIRMLKFKDDSFLDTLREKMHWGRDYRNE
jgi:NAD+ kinase